MRRSLLAPALFLLAGCAGGAEMASSSEPTAAPSSTTSSATTSSQASATGEPMPSAPAPAGQSFVDVVDDQLAGYAALIGAPASSADLKSVLSRFDGDVPLPAGSIVGVARIVERWGDGLDSRQIIGLDAAPGKEGLEEFGGAAPRGWAYNSISTTDSSSTLVMTRESDALRVVYMSSTDPGPGVPPSAFRLETDASELPQPVWLAALPVPEGGEVTAVGEGVGEVEIDYFPVGDGLVTATWRFPVDDLVALQEFYAGGALEAAGFALVDPDAITVGASYFDVTAGDWAGQVIVGEVMDGEDSYASVQWFLTRS